MFLKDAEVKEKLTVSEFLTHEKKFIQNLSRFGIYIGTHLEVLGKGPFKSPLKIKINNNIIALRSHEARLIKVKKGFE